MKRGTIVILIILVVAVAAAATSVWYHYRNQHRAQAFWGTSTALLIDKAPQVELVALGEVNRSISLEADAIEPEEKSDEKAGDDKAADEKPADADAPPPPKAVEFNQTPWVVLETKDAAAAKGIANLRRALVLDTTFDWAAPPAAAEPRWQYGVSVNDGRNWATVLFDFESRQVGLTGGRRTVLLEAEANEDFRRFFAEQFPKQPQSDAEGNESPAKAGG
jgi:hypothetical protein